MRKIFLFCFSVLCALILMTGAKAHAAYIDFEYDTTATNDALASFLNAEYSQYGIQFQFEYQSDDALAAIIGNVLQDEDISTATKKLQLIDTILYIKLSNPLYTFYCEKYEPSDSKFTISWDFLNSNDQQVYYYEDSIKDSWVSIPGPTVFDNIEFTSDQQVTTIKIADLDSIKVFYLDNLELDTYTTSSPVPEPAAMLLLSLGLMGIASIRRKFNHKISNRS